MKEHARRIMSEAAFILMLEDDTDHAERLGQGLREQGHACGIVTRLDEALESLRARQPDVIVVNERLAAERDEKLLSEARHLAPDAQIIVLGTETDLDDEVFARIEGDPDDDELQAVVVDAAAQAGASRKQRSRMEQSEKRVSFEGMITINENMIRMITRLKKIANSKLTVLILGESGTGKELVAQAIHKHSPRSINAYRAINCAGLNENLLESDLFGHVKGAFTGAVSDRKGLFEQADGGTLFLDEVGDMPLAMQAKLLRVLENGEIMPVGGTEIRKVDVRVLAATHRDLKAMVDDATFRSDLYYRLNASTLRLPPLRERRDDIPLLIDYFLELANREHDKRVEVITPEAVRKLTSHQWAGNVRELKSVIDAMVVLAESDELDMDDLPEHIRGTTEIVLAGAPSLAGLTMDQMQKLHIAGTLKLTGGNREKAAKMLGIGARTLYRKLREYGLQ